MESVETVVTLDLAAKAATAVTVVKVVTLELAVQEVTELMEETAVKSEQDELTHGAKLQML